MLNRLPFTFAAIAVFFAFAIAGCGDDAPESGGATPAAGATQTTSTGTTGGSNGGSTGGATDSTSTSASASAEVAYNACLTGAKSLPDKQQSADAAQRCKDAYENIKDASSKIDDAAADARANCEKAANAIENEQAKQSALAACAKFE